MADTNTGKMTVGKTGRKDREKVAEERGSEFYSEIGKKGGESRAEDLGHEGYQELGRKGGEARRGQGADYSAMGRKGDQSQGQYNNPGSFENDPEKAREAGRKGGSS